MKNKLLKTLSLLTLSVILVGCADKDADSLDGLGQIVVRGDVSSSIDAQNVEEAEEEISEKPADNTTEIYISEQTENNTQENSEKESEQATIPVEVIEVEATENTENENSNTSEDIIIEDNSDTAPGESVDTESQMPAPGENISSENFAFKLNKLYEESPQTNILRSNNDLRNFILKYADGLPEDFTNDSALDEVFDSNVMLCTVISGTSTSRYEQTSLSFDEAGELNLAVNHEIVQTLIEEPEGSWLIVTVIYKGYVNDQISGYTVNITGME